MPAAGEIAAVGGRGAASVGAGLPVLQEWRGGATLLPAVGSALLPVAAAVASLGGRCCYLWLPRLLPWAGAVATCSGRGCYLGRAAGAVATCGGRSCYLWRSRLLPWVGAVPTFGGRGCCHSCGDELPQGNGGATKEEWRCYQKSTSPAMLRARGGGAANEKHCCYRRGELMLPAGVAVLQARAGKGHSRCRRGRQCCQRGWHAAGAGDGNNQKLLSRKSRAWPAKYSFSNRVDSDERLVRPHRTAADPGDRGI